MKSQIRVGWVVGATVLDLRAVTAGNIGKATVREVSPPAKRKQKGK